jgi:hypothetical protein
MAQRYKGIARYVHIMKPSAPKGSDKLRYAINLLIHKSDPQCAVITAEIEAAKKNGFPSGFPAGADVCWHDLAVTEPANTAVKDYMCLKASSNVEFDRPHFVDQSFTQFIDPMADSNATGKVVYMDGYIGSYDKGSGGVKCYPNGVLVTEEVGAIPTDALSSKPDAKSMFADIGTGGTQAAPQQVAPYPASPPPPAPNTEPQYVMTAKAAGNTRQQLLDNGQGWTDELLLSQDMMTLPGGVKPSFAT